MTPVGQLDRFTYLVPDRWAELPTETDDSQWPRLVSGRLVNPEIDDDTREALHTQLRSVHSMAAEEPPAALLAWVSSPEVPMLSGIMVARELVADEPAEAVTREQYHALLESDPRADVALREQDIEDVELPAGSAVRELETMEVPVGDTPKSGVTLEFHMIYTLFPDGVSTALQFQFSTPDVPLAADFAAEADAIMNSVEVVVGQLR